MEIAIAKYTLIFSMLAGVAVVLKTVLGVLGISKKVGGAAKRVPLQLHILLRVRVFRRGGIFKGGVV